MNAQKARQISSAVLTGETGSQLSDILGNIKRAAAKGEFKCWYYENIHQVVRERLTEMGYIVGTTQFDRNETLTQIE